MALVVALAAVTLAGCGEIDDAGRTMATAPRRTKGTACEVERRTAETAVDAYLAEHGERPGSIADVVGPYLTTAPTYWKLSADGATLVPTPAGVEAGCTAPPG